MIACALALVHDFPVMYFVLKSCTLFVKKVIGRNSRKLVAAKYYWRGNTFLIFHILPSSSLENVFLSSMWISMFAIGKWKYTLKSNLNEKLARIEYINALRFWNYIKDWVKITQLHTRNSTSYLKQSQHQTTTCEK